MEHVLLRACASESNCALLGQKAEKTSMGMFTNTTTQDYNLLGHDAG